MRDERNSLWKIPIPTSEGENLPYPDSGRDIPSSEGVHASFNLEQMTIKASLIEFLHKAMFSPVKSTWLRAIRRNHFVTWPGINSIDVGKHLAPSLSTAKGHLDRKRKNIRPSRKITPNLDEHDEDIAPSS